MLADHHAIAKAGQGAGGHPAQAKRGGMAAKGIVGLDRGRHLGRVLRHAVIDDAVPIGIGPTVEAAIDDRGQVIGRGFVAKAVAFVHNGPEHAIRGPGHADRVAQATGKDADLFGRGVKLIDAGAALFSGKPVVGNVGVRADANIKL